MQLLKGSVAHVGVPAYVLTPLDMAKVAAPADSREVALDVSSSPYEKPLVVVRTGDKGGKTPLEVAHAILAEHNLPYGLLPMESLVECIYNPNDGRFCVTQPVDECDATFGGHKLKLCREVRGRLDHNLIRELKGVKVKAAPFIWLNIWSVDTDAKPGNMIHFRAGPFNASIDAQELWDYCFWAPAFHQVLEKEPEALPLGKAAETFTKLASKLHAPRAAASGSRV